MQLHAHKKERYILSVCASRSLCAQSRDGGIGQDGVLYSMIYDNEHHSCQTKYTKEWWVGKPGHKAAGWTGRKRRTGVARHRSYIVGNVGSVSFFFGSNIWPIIYASISAFASLPRAA